MFCSFLQNICEERRIVMEDLPFFQAHDEQFSASGIYFPEQQVSEI